MYFPGCIAWLGGPGYCEILYTPLSPTSAACGDRNTTVFKDQAIAPDNLGGPGRCAGTIALKTGSSICTSVFEVYQHHTMGRVRNTHQSFIEVQHNLAIANFLSLVRCQRALSGVVSSLYFRQSFASILSRNDYVNAS